MKYKLIIFDCDGTLLYTLDDLTEAVNYANETLGLKTYTSNDLIKFVGNGIGALIKEAIGEKNLNMYDKAMELFKEHYSVHFADKTIPYSGILEILRELKNNGYLLALVSNKNKQYLRLLYNKYFSEDITICIGESEDLRKKPAPDMVEFVLNDLNISKSDVVYVGDSEVDMQTAQNSGVDFIAVSWGYRTKEFLMKCGAKTIIDTPHQILNYLNY